MNLYKEAATQKERRKLREAQGLSRPSQKR